MMNNSFEEILSVIANSQDIAVAGHTSPDGDAVGSCCALAMALEQKGKSVTLILEEIPKVFKSIPYSENAVALAGEKKFDLLLALDCGDRERLGDNAELIDTVFTVNIDHHESNTFFGRLNYVESGASSTSEIIYKLLDSWSKLNSDIARALYTGIIFDTGCFKHSCTGSMTMKIAGELMSYDIPFTEIQEEIFYSHTLTEAKMLKTAIENMELYCGGRLAVTRLSAEEMAENGGGPDDTNDIIAYVKNIESVDTAVFFYEKAKGVIKASMRSNDTVNVSKIAVKFGGGGHARAGGCTISSETDVGNIVNELKQALEV